MEEKKILVTGIGGNVGQGVLRNIRAVYPDVKIVGTDISAFTAGNHLCEATYAVPYSYSETYIPAMVAIAKSEKPHLIIPTTDYEVFYLARNRDLFDCPVAVSQADTAKIYLDKYLTFKHCEKIGVPFAKSWLPSEYDNSQSDIILKPREGRGSRGLAINPADPSSFGDDYMIQPLHKGKEITTAFYVKKDGSLHGLFTMERELSNGATSKSVVTFDYDERMREIIQKMIQGGGLQGSLNVQSIVTGSGEIVPFEVNCRISGTNSIRHNLGFQDVIYTLQEHLFDQNPDAVKAINGVAVRLLYDIIYPGAQNEMQLNNRHSEHIIY